MFGIYGACRREELANMSTSDVDYRRSVIIVTIPKTKTNKKRVFTIVDDDAIRGLELYNKYVALRPRHVPNNRFFLQYKKNACINQPVGKNTFGAIPKTVAIFLQLPNPEKYTGHTFRRTSATLLADSGADITSVKRHGGWKSSSVAEGYLEDSIEQKNKTARLIFGTGENCWKSDASFKIAVSQQENQLGDTAALCSSSNNQSDNPSTISVENIVFNNLSNCTFHIHQK